MVRQNIVLDGNGDTTVRIPQQAAEIILSLSNDLAVFGSPPTEAYVEQIAGFVGQSDLWYANAVAAVFDYGQKVYGSWVDEFPVRDITLLAIHILFDVGEPPLFGLEFGTKWDSEHGCGLKICGGNFEITDIGGADAAFC